jgi:hypothetical protein
VGTGFRRRYCLYLATKTSGGKPPVLAITNEKWKIEGQEFSNYHFSFLNRRLEAGIARRFKLPSKLSI